MTGWTRRRFLKQAALCAAAAGVKVRCGRAGEPVSFAPRLAICNETFLDWPFDKAFALAAECGYQGLEVAPFTIGNYVTDIPASRRREIRRQAEKAGLEVVGLHWLLAKTEGFHLTSADREVRKRTAGYLGELARFCADLGGQLLVFGSPQQRNLAAGMELEEGMKYAAEVFQSLIGSLEKTDTVLALEPLSPKTTNFLFTADQGAELVRRVGSPRCRLHLDVLAMSSESTPAATLIRRHGEMLAHFHANDPNGQGPGMGQADLAPVFEALAEVDYKGWVSVEVFDTTPGPERIARESIRYMRETLRGLNAKTPRPTGVTTTTRTHQQGNL